MNSKPSFSQTAPQIPETYYLEHSVGCGHILIADDHTLIRELVAEALKDSGYNVDCVADGEEAWDALCKEDYDLLITDNEMPRLTGLDLLHRIRTSPFELPAILMSGNLPTKADGFEKDLARGGTLAKPFSLDQILEMVHAVLLSPSEGLRSQA